MKRFIAVIAGLLVVAATLTGCASRGNMASAGWITLVDGGSGLENFLRVGDANWREQDGSIVADKGGKETSYLVTRSSFTDFVIYAEFWASNDANSGVWFRLSDRLKISSANAYEAQINDGRTDGYGTGAIAGVAKVSPALKAGGKWNSFEITAKGSQLTVKMNGVTTANISDRSFFHGPFALQYGTGIVKFRKVQIKPI